MNHHEAMKAMSAMSAASEIPSHLHWLQLVPPRPLHYAAQLRPKDGATVCAALLKHRAQLDATTRRGHTALLFAAGRGHGEAPKRISGERWGKL